ncbi:hypothetical protein B5X24_HaOG208975 [Helicoverpa armigera]|uniref:Uncharacterized protein n=1 Tax=Helicoverpa armigera TaxID=29058 RepID=A0A2W1BJ39_HELAM|nr:hypothetical protein B5X24_HaOG208975 [Helicoverpa armigera]
MSGDSICRSLPAVGYRPHAWGLITDAYRAPRECRRAGHRARGVPRTAWPHTDTLAVFLRSGASFVRRRVIVQLSLLARAAFCRALKCLLQYHRAEYHATTDINRDALSFRRRQAELIQELARRKAARNEEWSHDTGGVTRRLGCLSLMYCCGNTVALPTDGDDVDKDLFLVTGIDLYPE